MQSVKVKGFRYYLKWVLWVLLVQIVLVNISASIYAYKFTHFYDPPAPPFSSRNIFTRTWKLFVGPDFYKNTSETDPSFAYESVRLRTSEGIAVDAWYSPADSSRTCVIFIHCYSTNKSFIEREAAMFKHWGYSILLLDLRGHGKSGSNTTSFGVKETDEVQKAFDFAKQKGNSKIILYGASMGAAICIKAAAEGNIHPDAVIADMPFGDLHHHFKARIKILGFPSEPFASLITFWIGVEQGYNGFHHDVRSYAKKLDCPVLLEWGDQDQYVSREETESIFSNLLSKNKRLVVYPGAGHIPFVQVDPDQWAEEMQAFLKPVL